MRAELEQHIRNRNYPAALAISRRLYDRARPQAEIAAMHGHVLQQSGLHAEARPVLEQAGMLQPRLPSVWIDLANACIALADWNNAAAAAARFRALAPNSGAGIFAEAEILLGLGRADQAEAEFRRAAATHPAFLERRLQLAAVASDRGHFDRANWHYQSLLVQAADMQRVHIDYLASLFQQRQYPQAAAVARAALLRWPNELRLLQRLSALLDLTDCDPAERVQIRERWLAQAPHSVDAHVALANALAAAGDYPSAQQQWQQARTLAPDQVLARWTALHFPTHVPFLDADDQQEFVHRWNRELDFFEALPVPDRDTCLRLIQSCSNHLLMYAEANARASLQRRGSVLSGWCESALSTIAGTQPAAITRERRRIGIVSSSFGWHSVSRVWRELLLALDRTHLELIGFNIDSIEDASTAQWRQRCDAFIEPQGGLQQWHAVLSQADIDVLIFLDLGPNPVVQALATQRYAPVQCTTWAHPVTSGLASIDYFLSSDLMEPENGAMHYSEQLIRLPGLACAYRPDAPEPNASEPRNTDPDRAVRYLCVQTPFKCLPVHDALFARVLAQTGDAMLTLSHGAQECVSAAMHDRLAPVLQAHSIDAQRLRVQARMPYAQYVAELQRSDVMLDTLNFSGCLTSLDALSVGLPIVTLPGETMRSRQTAAMLRLLDLPELIARDQDDYVRIAVELGRNSGWRESLRRRIGERRDRLFDTAQSVSGLESFLRSAQPAARQVRPQT
jgi:protein O-GlcNAc transferase